MSAILTRRELAAALLASSAASQALAQPRRISTAEELQGARDKVRRNGVALSQLKVDIALEPAFQFKA